MIMRSRILCLLLCLVIAVSGTVMAAAADEGEVTVRVTNSESEVTVGYKETRYFEFRAENLPEGASVHVYCNGEDRGEDTYLGVYSPTDDYTVEAKVLDAAGNVIAESGTISVHVQNGFSDRLQVSVKKAVSTFFDAVFDIFGAIFMRIWIFLHP